MGERWLPYAAAALATGACALVMGALVLQSAPNGSELVDTLTASPDRWLLASAAFMYAAFALTLGIPTFLHMIKTRGRATAQAGALLFACGTIGTAGYAAMLILFRALVVHAVVEGQDIEALSRDSGLLVYMGAFVLAFTAGLVLLGVALLMAGTVARWIPVLMIAYAVTMPLTGLIPDGWHGLHTLVLGGALIGVAVAANESWSGVSRHRRR